MKEPKNKGFPKFGTPENNQHCPARSDPPKTWQPGQGQCPEFVCSWMARSSFLSALCLTHHFSRNRVVSKKSSWLCATLMASQRTSSTEDFHPAPVQMTPEHHGKRFQRLRRKRGTSTHGSCSSSCDQAGFTLQQWPEDTSLVCCKVER